MKTINKILSIGALTLALAGCGSKYNIDGNIVETPDFITDNLRETKPNGTQIEYSNFHDDYLWVRINGRSYNSSSEGVGYLIFVNSRKRQQYLWNRVHQIWDSKKDSIENAKINLIINNIDSVRDYKELNDLKSLNK